MSSPLEIKGYSRGMDKSDLLPIGEIAQRSGVSVPMVRFYEERGLIQSVRNSGNHRRYGRHTLRRIAVVRAGQRFGLSLAEIGEALATLPDDHPPTKRDWVRMSKAWHTALDERIAALIEVRDGLTGCIGCGCLSLTSCPIYNPEDWHAADGAGAQRWPAAARGD